MLDPIEEACKRFDPTLHRYMRHIARDFKAASHANTLLPYIAAVSVMLGGYIATQPAAEREEFWQQITGMIRDAMEYQGERVQ